MERGQEKNNPESAENSTNEAGEYRQLRYRDLRGLKEARRVGHIPITPGGEGDRDSMCSTPIILRIPRTQRDGCYESQFIHAGTKTQAVEVTPVNAVISNRRSA